MKTAILYLIPWPALLALLILNIGLASVSGQGTAFSYQGQLSANGSPANGSYDIAFALFATNISGVAIAGPITNSATAVSNGLFSVTLDFGPGVFTGSNYWLDISVSPAGNNTFTELTPRQPILPVPYAVMANSASNLLGTLPATQVSGSLPASQITGTIPLAQLPSAVVTNGATGVNISGAFSGDGSGLANVPGTVVWQPVASTNITDAVNSYYLLTNNDLDTLTLEASPSVGDSVTVSGTGTNGWEVLPAAGQTIIGQTFAAGLLWSQQSSLSTNASWQQVAMSSDGRVLAVTDQGSGEVWVSTNYGANWSESLSVGETIEVISSSADGSHLVTAFNNGHVWTSTNYGANWTQQTASPLTTWTAITSSSDGSHLVGVTYNYGGTWTSTNFGVNWTQQSGLSTNNYDDYYGLAASSDGSHLVTGEANAGAIYTSTNFGVNWIEQSNAPTSANWYSFASDSTGQYLVAVAGLPSGWIYTSTNFGVNWTRQNVPQLFWISVASSSDGSHLVAAANGGGIWTSADYGNTWTQGVEPTGDWQRVASSADGNYLMATLYAGGGAGVYLSTGVPVSFFGVAGETAQFQYIGDGQWQVTSSGVTPTIPASLLPTPIMTNGFLSDANGFADSLNRLRLIITIHGIKTLASILSPLVSGAPGLNASALSGGVIPQSVLPGFQGTFDTVGGGSNNIADGGFSTVPGGLNNTASGAYSFAAGYNAQAANLGSFVWSDGTGTLTTSTNDDSVTMRASGGYRFFTGTGIAGAQLKAGATSWSTLSDRNLKKNFAPVNCEAILDKLVQVPIQQWNYKWEADTNTPNIGPMAQDFKAAFYPGRDNCTISTLEFDGVELAAIQGLNQKLGSLEQELKQRDAGVAPAAIQGLNQKLAAQGKEKDAEIADLKQELNELKAEVKSLEKRN